MPSAAARGRGGLGTGSKMSLSVDYSVILQIITFIVVWTFLRRLVFDPFTQVIEQRQARTTGTQAAASALTAEAGATRSRYDGAIAAARTDLAQHADAARKSAQEESDHALAAARSAASDTMARQRDAVAREIDTTRQALLAQADNVANEMLARVTGKGAA